MKKPVILILLLTLAGAFAVAAPAPKAGKGGADEEPPKIEGLEISRGAKGFLGLEIVSDNFKLTFYDEEKKPTTPDVASALLRWNSKVRVAQERVALLPGGGEHSLTSSRFIRPPYVFKLFITLLKDSSGNSDADIESFVVDYRP